MLVYLGHVIRNDTKLEKKNKNSYARRNARTKESRETANDINRKGGGIDTD